MNPVLNECLGRHKIEVAGEEVITGRIGMRSKGADGRGRCAHGDRARLVQLDPVNAVDTPGQSPVQTRLPRLVLNRPESPDDSDLVGLQGRDPVAR